MKEEPSVKLPYFDYLFAAIAEQNSEIESSFGHHVHWGYWQNPALATNHADDFLAASENLSKQVCQAARIKNTQQLLDVGCGFGGTLALLNEQHSDMLLFGLNLDDRQLQRARQQVLAKATNSIHFQQGNACQLPFADNSFDRLLAIECIFHFPDREQFFQEAMRVLKPGGYLALSDFVPKKSIIPLLKFNLPKPFNIGFYGKCHVTCTADGYRELAQQTGFSIEQEDDITLNTLPTYTYLRALAKKNRVTGIAAMLETLTLEILSRLKMIKYYVYAFKKPT